MSTPPRQSQINGSTAATNGHANGVSHPNGDSHLNGFSVEQPGQADANAPSNVATDASKLPGSVKDPSEEERPPAEDAMPPHSHVQMLRDKVSQAVSQFVQLTHSSLRPLPTETGDGTYVVEDTKTGFLSDALHVDPKDIETMIEALKGQLEGELIDDKSYIMERVIQLASKLPTNSNNGAKLTGAFVQQLWDNLQHPPQSFISKQYQYRAADGSNNNVMFPRLGAAKTAYARSVQPRTIQSAARPDPGLIFDSVMVRKEFERHPSNISSMLFYVASIIIHDLFRTSHEDFGVSETSSYLDLSPLYGNNQDEQNSIRTLQDGKLKPDCFCEKRLLGFPPGVGCILIMFNRFHNYVVGELALINESGRFTKPKDGDDQKKWDKYDNDLFQTGRLITCGLYINIILLDYVRTILNLNRTTSQWNLDPRGKVDKPFGQGEATHSIGNQVSAEFNLIYRWHAAISERDDKWTQQIYRELFPGREPEDVSMPELLATLSQMDARLPADPQKRPFANLTREANGTFKDGDLVEILADSIEDPAGAFGANNVPRIMRSVEMLGIIQARTWNLATLNEFRTFFGLTPHESFEDINADPEVADQLRHLYETPDKVEIYPGVVLEDAKKTMAPGSGLATNYTISRAILSDAVSLVRSDRFYTIDYHPQNLTNWGFHEVQYDTTIDEGCVFYKLFLRSFPHHFKSNSVYAHFPLTIPSENQKILKDLDRAEKYDFGRPTLIKPDVLITSYTVAKKILEDQKNFHVTWGEGLGVQIGQPGRDYMLANDTSASRTQRETIGAALYRDQWRQQIKEFYEDITLRLLREKSYTMAGAKQVDIIRDVGNLAQVHLAANIFSLPLKTKEHEYLPLTEHDMYLALTVMFIRVFFNFEPAKSFELTQLSHAAAQGLGKLIELNGSHSPLSDYGVHMVRKLLDSGMGAYDVAWSMILPTAAAMVAPQAQTISQMVDYYLSDEGKKYLPELQRLAKEDTPEADEKILRYAMEGIRLADAFGAYREAVSDVSLDVDGKKKDFKQGDRVLISFVDAMKDSSIFPDPEQVRLDRDMDLYIHYGAGPHRCLGADISQVALTAMLKTICRLENLRRAPGPQGELKKVDKAGGFRVYMQEDWSDYFPFPTSMKVRWDGELPEPKKY